MTSKILNILCKTTWMSSFILLTMSKAVLWRGLSDDVLFECNFSQDSCRMENQEVTEAQWQRTFLNEGGISGYALVVRGNEAQNHIARILTPNLSTLGLREGCLSFRYYLEGMKPVSLSVIKQGYVTQYVFSTAYKTEGHWKQAAVDVQFLGDYAMFYFEADTQVQDFDDSLVAISDIKITSQTCVEMKQRSE
ncbi:uncharacterized protein LOC129221247 [Uloborus diversus]|uniref:uncharacterized protein LOC129221247 n=1 Tax=Uloborus diversus TaxID=327109 RepID=UPI00240A60C4|nr:uncharacterized protein LOC129221247 [Uloborus diversus]